MTLTNRFLAGLVSAFLALTVVGCAHDRTVGTAASDVAITTKVKAALLGDPDVAGTTINVETLRGVVQLSGFPKSAAMAQRAVDLAQRVDGVDRVINKMTITP